MKVKPLAARQYGLRKLVHLGGGKNEYNMLGRLLKGFEQSVERLGGEHVHLVNDIDAEPCLCGLELHLVNNVADVVYLSVGRGVHLNNVEHRAAVYAPAYLALAARASVLRIKAVDRLGKYLGAGGFARSARAGKQVGVTVAALGYFIFKGRGNMLLTRHVLKALRAPLAVKHLIHRLTSR